MSKMKTIKEEIERAHDALLDADSSCNYSLVMVDTFALDASADGSCSDVLDLAAYVVGMMGDMLRDVLADNGALDIAATMSDSLLARAYASYFRALFC